MEIMAVDQHNIELSDRRNNFDVHIYDAKGINGDVQDALRAAIVALLGIIELNENNQIEVSLFAAVLKDKANTLMDGCLALQFQTI